ncbi:MAG TPA: NAD(P)-dependent oxidoreductase [Saprospiraceae bacterium]|nr:NAD(P)-dependent oxidoreductase [Saprospiraceae bacterium]
MGNMSEKDVLVTDYVHPVLLEGLRMLGYKTTYAPEMTREEMEFHLSSYKGVVVNTRCSIDKRTIEAAPVLKWIARLGSGLDIIDVDTALKKGIRVISAPEGNAQAVAEHALGMLLCLANKLLPADREVRQGKWMREKSRGWEITGKTIGIIGYGNNGSAFGRLLQGWDVRILAYDKYKVDFGSAKVTEADLDLLLRESDIISFHVPLSPETKEMLNEDFISGCRHGVVMINVSRGKVVKLKALVDALRSGYIKGACLDVLPYEPPASGPDEFKILFEELCAFENVVLSPHIAGWTMESKKKISEIIIGKLKEMSRT